MTRAAIRLEDAGKRYIKYEDEPMLLTRMLSLHKRSRRSALWAIRHVDLTVGTGESLGIIGRNGSGKSTLLQMLAGVTAPTEGSVSVRGRVAPLVSVGVGFHPELTGRENVYVNGMILGLSRAQLDRRFDSIVAFSGIEDFIDTPVKFYSSGMYVRLGFSVAIETTPDVLLVDEVLAVGDLAFQVKCFERMAEIRQSGTTVVVVSHNLNAIRHLCDRAYVIHDGSPRFDGGVEDAIALYHELLGESRDIDDPGLLHERGIDAGYAEIEDVRLLTAARESARQIVTGSEVLVEADVRFDRPVERPFFGVALVASSGMNVYSESNRLQSLTPAEAGERRTYSMRMRLPLATGSYTLNTGVHRAEGETLAATQLASGPPLLFYVAGRNGMGGVVDLRAEFDESSERPRRVEAG